MPGAPNVAFLLLLVRHLLLVAMHLFLVAMHLFLLASWDQVWKSRLQVQILGTMTNPEGKQFSSAITLARDFGLLSFCMGACKKL